MEALSGMSPSICWLKLSFWPLSLRGAGPRRVGTAEPSGELGKIQWCWDYTCC